MKATTQRRRWILILVVALIALASLLHPLLFFTRWSERPVPGSPPAVAAG